MIDHSQAPAWGPNLLYVYWIGLTGRAWYHEEFFNDPEHRLPSRPLSAHAAAVLVDFWKSRFALPETNLVVIGDSGDLRCFSDRGGREHLDAILDQIRRSTSDSLVPGELPESMLAEIVAHGGLDQ